MLTHLTAFFLSSSCRTSQLNPPFICFTTAERIINFIENRLSIADDPGMLGVALKGSELGSFWKYRVGDYRVIASIHDLEVTITVVKIGNRKEVYR